MNQLKRKEAPAKGAPVFPSSRQKTSAASKRRGNSDHLNGPWGWFTTVLAEAKVENHTWHCNRHTFASRLVMAGVGLRQVGELLGHGTPQLVWRYSHLAPDHHAAAVELLVTPGAQIGLVTKSATDHKMPETEGNGMASNIAK